MAKETSIGWTDATWPVVQGCDYDSPGCTNCYAVPLIWRLAHNPNPTISAPLQGLVEKRGRKLVWTGKVALREDRLRWPLDWKEPRKIFVPSHGDLFHPAVPDAFIDKAFAVMALTPQHTYQVLTKRSERMRDYVLSLTLTRLARAHEPGTMPMIAHEIETRLLGSPLAATRLYGNCKRPEWPLPNVWLGVSVEDQTRADERIPALLQTPAAVRFLSCEPLLGPIDLTSLRNSAGLGEGQPWLNAVGSHGVGYVYHDADFCSVPRIDWVIVGGESGPGAREHHLEWDRHIISQCRAAGVAVFEKQIGTKPMQDDGRFGYPGLRDRKGADLAEWPYDLRIQQFPKAP